MLAKIDWKCVKSTSKVLKTPISDETWMKVFSKVLNPTFSYRRPMIHSFSWFILTSQLLNGRFNSHRAVVTRRWSTIYINELQCTQHRSIGVTEYKMLNQSSCKVRLNCGSKNAFMVYDRPVSRRNHSIIKFKLWSPIAFLHRWENKNNGAVELFFESPTIRSFSNEDENYEITS